jgi:3-oxoacyl-[acyl-carrier protein] reductase
MRLDGQVAVVTGGSRGIGREVAKKLSAEGAKVVIAYAGNDEAAKKTAEECRDAVCVKADVSDEAAVEKLFEEAMKINGRIDILVNCAGITKDNLVLRMSAEDFDRVMKVNLYGSFYCSRCASKIMLKQRYGRIISVSSIVGLRGNAGQANYAASKAGVIGMTKSMAKELAKRNITVNAIAPGMIETDMTAVLPENIKDEMLKTIPMGRPGKAEEVAEAILFFASKESSYVTGQVLAVDGGMAV